MSTLRRVIQVPYTFSLMNWAAIAGLFYYLNRNQEFWDMAVPSAKRKAPAPQLRGL